MKDKKEKTVTRRVIIVKIGILLFTLISLSFIGYYVIKNFIVSSEGFRSFVDEHMLAGSLIAIFLCALQVVVAFIPGEFVEIAIGYIYGAWYGSLLCLVGITVGSIFAILIARRFGRELVYALYPKEKLEGAFLFKDKTGRNLLTFLLYLIPGTPKDCFTYAIGLTDMSILHYLLLTVLARYPSVISSCFGGHALGSSGLADAIIIMAVTAGVSVVGLFVYRIIVVKRTKSGKRVKK